VRARGALPGADLPHVERRLNPVREMGFVPFVGQHDVGGLGRLRAFLNAREPSRQLGGCVGGLSWMPEVAPDVERMRRAGAGRG
jgi:hypothetical protein